jgi:hypothetical protein
MAQGYLDWFNNTPLALYTSPNITGALLDWVGTYFYGVRRPVFGSFSSYAIGPVNSFVINTLAVNGSETFTSGSAAPVDDDIYKRVLTWWFYRGDGKNMSVDWIKRRVTRFLYGVNGGDVPYPSENPPGITLETDVFIGALNSFTMNTLPFDGGGSETILGFTITVPIGSAGTALQSLVAANLLALPFENNFTVVLE